MKGTKEWTLDLLINTCIGLYYMLANFGGLGGLALTIDDVSAVYKCEYKLCVLRRVRKHATLV